MVLLTLQASAEDHSHGAGLVPADLWDSSELSVLGQCQGGDAHAAELPELCPAAARLYDPARHPQRSVKAPRVSRLFSHNEGHECVTNSEVNRVVFHRRQEHRADFKNQVVEIFGDGFGRRGGKLCRCEGVPVHHPDEYTGKRKHT